MPLYSRLLLSNIVTYLPFFHGYPLVSYTQYLLVKHSIRLIQLYLKNLFYLILYSICDNIRYGANHREVYDEEITDSLCIYLYVHTIYLSMFILSVHVNAKIYVLVILSPSIHPSIYDCDVCYKDNKHTCTSNPWESNHRARNGPTSTSHKNWPMRKEITKTEKVTMNTLYILNHATPTFIIDNKVANFTCECLLYYLCS